jgi:hypothetical protein
VAGARLGVSQMQVHRPRVRALDRPALRDGPEPPLIPPGSEAQAIALLRPTSSPSQVLGSTGTGGWMQRGWAVRLAVALALCLGAIGSAVPAQADWYGNPENLAATDLGGGRTLSTWTPPNRDVYRRDRAIARSSGIGYGRSQDVHLRWLRLVRHRLRRPVHRLRLALRGPGAMAGRGLEALIGETTSSRPSSCAREVPKAPASVAATGGNGTASVSWALAGPTLPPPAAPSPTPWTSPGGPVCTTKAHLPATWVAWPTGRRVGVLRVRRLQVRQGTSGIERMRSLPADPRTEPLAVQAFLEKAGALVAWQGPASTGGAPITRYVVVSSPATSPARLQANASGVVAGTA